MENLKRLGQSPLTVMELILKPTCMRPLFGFTFSCLS